MGEDAAWRSLRTAVLPKDPSDRALTVDRRSVQFAHAASGAASCGAASSVLLLGRQDDRNVTRGADDPLVALLATDRLEQEDEFFRQHRSSPWIAGADGQAPP